MIIVMKPKAADKNIKAVTQYIEANGLTAHLSQGEQVTIIGVVGDKSRLSTENIALLADVDRIVPVTESYKLANLKFHPEPAAPLSDRTPGRLWQVPARWNPTTS